MRYHSGLLTILFLFGCAKVVSVQQIPEISLGESTFFPTIEAHTDAPITAGNRIDVLLNGDETFPVILRDIKAAKSTITFAQYLFEGGTLATEFAQAFAERCRAGIEADILLDDHGSGKTPAEIIALMRDAGCHVEFFRRVEVPAVIFPWKLLQYNYRNHRRILVIDGRVGFTGGYGISDTWLGDGRTPEHWRDTNARIEGPAVKFLQAAFAESWLETTGTAIGGAGYFPRLEPVGKLPAQIVSSSPAGGSFQNYMLFLLSINSARKTILIANPYFIPDDVMTEALLKAVSRGVRVIVLAPGKIDSQLTYTVSRSHYGRSIAGGRRDLRISSGADARQDHGHRWHLGDDRQHELRQSLVRFKPGTQSHGIRCFAGAPPRNDFSRRLKIFEKNNLRRVEFAQCLRTALRAFRLSGQRTALSDGR